MILAAIGTAVALLIWPTADPAIIAHSHDDLPSDDPHVIEHHPGGTSAHDFVIDDRHPHWPQARM
jgi:hypothetical protein